MIPSGDNELKYALIRAWNTIPGGTFAGVTAEMLKGLITIDATSSPFLRVSYSLINGDIVD